MFAWLRLRSKKRLDVEHERLPESSDLILSSTGYGRPAKRGHDRTARLAAGHRGYPMILDPGWGLLGFLEMVGADKFTLRFLYDGDPGGVGRAHSDALFARLEAYYLGERERERPGLGLESVEAWRFDQESRQALKDVLPDGIMWELLGGAWCEDLCVYRGGELLLGTISHESEAFLRLDGPEITLFEAWVLREQERLAGAPRNESPD